MNKFETKDSGERVEYESGMRRDVDQGKPGFILTLTDQPYEEQMHTRWAALMTRGAEKYGRRNWQKADSQDELERFKASAYRHFMQWLCGEDDEDHAAAVFFNINAAEYVKWKLSWGSKLPKITVDEMEDIAQQDRADAREALERAEHMLDEKAEHYAD